MRIRSGEHLIKEVKRVAAEAVLYGEDQLKNLTPEQLSYIPESGAWSINQVLAHLNSYSKYYNRTIKERIEQTRHDIPKEKYVPSPLGLATVKSMRLGKANNVRRKLKSPKIHNPLINKELEVGDQLSIFLSNQIEIQEIADIASEINLNRTKVPLAIAKRVKLRLGDALLFISYHVERHLQQIKNIKKEAKFPS